MLLALMVLASAAMAGDRQLKALIVGTWTWSEGDENPTMITYQTDGVELVGRHNYEMKWEVKNGELIETPDPDAQDRTIWPSSTSQLAKRINVYAILFLTKHEFLIREKSAGSYIFMSR